MNFDVVPAHVIRSVLCCPCDQIFDLLADRTELVLREDKNGVVQVVGLSEHRAESASDVMEQVTAGQMQRRTTATHVNADSSRSHAVLQVTVYSASGEDVIGRVCLVDLAGTTRSLLAPVLFALLSFANVL